MSAKFVCSEEVPDRETLLWKCECSKDVTLISVSPDSLFGNHDTAMVQQCADFEVSEAKCGIMVHCNINTECMSSGEKVTEQLLLFWDFF